MTPPFKKNFCPGCRIIPLGTRSCKFFSIAVHIWNFDTSGIHHRCCIPGIVIVSGCHKAGKLRPAAEYSARTDFSIMVNSTPASPAHGMSASDTLHMDGIHTDLADPRLNSHTLAGLDIARIVAFALQNTEFAGMHIHSAWHRFRAFFHSTQAGQKGSRFGTFIEASHRDASVLYTRAGLKVEPHTRMRKFVLVVIGKHQLCLSHPENLHPSNSSSVSRILPPNDFHIKQTVITLAAFNIMCNSVAVVVLLIDIGLWQSPQELHQNRDWCRQIPSGQILFLQNRFFQWRLFPPK